MIRAMHPDWPETGIPGTLANVEVRADGTIAPWLTLDRHLAILAPPVGAPPVRALPPRRGRRAADPGRARPAPQDVTRGRGRGWRRSAPAWFAGSPTTTCTPSTPSRSPTCFHGACERAVLAVTARAARDHGLRGDQPDHGQDPPAAVLPARPRPGPGGVARHAVRLPGERRRHLGPGRRVLPGERRPPHRGGQLPAGRERSTPSMREASLARIGAGPLGLRRARQPDLRPAPVARHRDPGAAGRQAAPRRLRRPSPAPPPSPSGIATVPVYEVYKVGADPVWEEGLDLVAEAGLKVGRHPPLRQRRGRQPRHPVLLPGRAPAADAGGRSSPTTHSSSASTSTPASCSTSTPATATVVGLGPADGTPPRTVGDGAERLDGAHPGAGGPGHGKRAGRRRPPRRSAPMRRRLRRRPGETPRRCWPASGSRRRPSTPPWRPRRRRRGPGHPRARRHPGGVVARHPAVRRAGPGPGRPAADGRAAGPGRPGRRPGSSGRRRARTWPPCSSCGREARPAAGASPTPTGSRDRLVALGLGDPRHPRRLGVGPAHGG